MNRRRQTLVNRPGERPLERANPALPLAGVAVNANPSSIPIFGPRRQGDKSHTCRQKRTASRPTGHDCL